MNPHFFITGGTGLVGRSLLPRLLKQFPASTITLLTRADSDEHAQHRLKAVAREIETDDGIADAAQRINAVRGDVALENFGLSSKQRDRIVKETTHLLHGAATIRFDHPIEEARELNCGGTKKALALAQQCLDKGTLQRFIYIGSSSVSGQRGGHIYEHELEMGQKFFNTYEQSKNESERIVRDHFDKIPCTVFRPSIIIGDSRTGKTSTFNVIYIPLRLVQKGLLTYVPGTPDTLMDLVPIDWVDDAMVHIMSKPESVSGVFHITAGPKRAARLNEVVVAAVEYFDKHTPLKHPRTMEFISRKDYEKRRSAMRGREEALMSQLDTLLPYVTVNRLFDSTNADKLLEGSRIKFPLFKNYSDTIFEYCVKTNWGKY